MSLDVCLEVEVPGVTGVEQHQIWTRENGQNRQISRDEWEQRFPGREPVTVYTDRGQVFEANITHNLGRMAKAAGIYDELWCPACIGITTAAQLIDPLTRGLAFLQQDPTHFQQFNPTNGWGNYEVLVQFVETYLQACIMYPEAMVLAYG